MTWNRPTPKTIEAPRRKPKKWAYALIVLTLISAILILFVFTNSDRKKEPVARNRSLRPATVTNRVAHSSAKVSVASSTKKPEDSMEPVESQTPSNETASVTNAMPQVDRWGNPKHRRRFDTGTEYILAMLFSTTPGQPPPHLPQIPLHELDRIGEILSRPTEILPDDGKSLREMKAKCDLAKAEFKKFIEEGGDDSEFLDYYRKKFNDYYRQWRDGQDMVDKAYEEGNKEDARALTDRINKLFDIQGIRHVSYPDD